MKFTLGILFASCLLGTVLSEPEAQPLPEPKALPYANPSDGASKEKDNILNKLLERVLKLLDNVLAEVVCLLEGLLGDLGLGPLLNDVLDLLFKHGLLYDVLDLVGGLLYSLVNALTSNYGSDDDCDCCDDHTFVLPCLPLHRPPTFAELTDCRGTY